MKAETFAGMKIKEVIKKENLPVPMGAPPSKKKKGNDGARLHGPRDIIID